MKLRLLILDDGARARIAAVRAHAEDPAHYYRPGRVDHCRPEASRPPGDVPGDDPRHCVDLFTGVRAVFSLTAFGAASGRSFAASGGTARSAEETGICRFRHLSVSVNEPGCCPHPAFVLELAHLFGFTGWEGPGSGMPADWETSVHPHEDCVVVAQAIDRRPGGPR